MVHTLTLPPPGFDDLTIEDQLDYVNALWERITSDPNKVPVPEWHRTILDERLAEYEKDPEEGQEAGAFLDELTRELQGNSPRR